MIFSRNPLYGTKNKGLTAYSEDDIGARGYPTINVKSNWYFEMPRSTRYYFKRLSSEFCCSPLMGRLGNPNYQSRIATDMSPNVVC